MKDQLSREILKRFRRERITIASTSVEIAKFPPLEAARERSRWDEDVDDREAH